MEALSTAQIQTMLPDLNGWSYQDGFLQKTIRTKDFREAFTLMTRIAFEVEQLNHHPTWENTYNTLHIKLNTHDCNGVSQKDFTLAKVIDSLTGPY